MLLLHYPIKTMGLCVINDRSKKEYSELLLRIKEYPAKDFWRHLPDKSENWLLPFSIFGEKELVREPYAPTMKKSHCIGSKCSLMWTVQPPKNYNQFTAFADELQDVMPSMPSGS